MEHRKTAKHKRPAHRRIRPVKKSKKPERLAKSYPVKYIVVHCTCTGGVISAREMVRLHGSPYHYIITRSGKLECLRPVGRKEQRIEIAWLGGLDRTGRHVDNRTGEQNETLFTTLTLLADAFDTAEIVGADELYPFGFANPGFDVKEWLKNYLPTIVFALI